MEPDSAAGVNAAGIPAVLGDRYRLTGLLGQGTRARVFSADDLLLGRRVAVKVFRDHAGTDRDVHRQEAEARLVASLNHYALTSLFDVGVTSTVDGEPQLYLVMEQVPEGTLRQALQAQGPWEPFKFAWLAYDLSDGLRYLHEAGYLHGDISPTNVLMDHRGNHRPLLGKLADFGIASIAAGTTADSYTASSATYLAPEQVEGAPASRASDYYSLGLVLLEILTGRMEYPGDNATSARARLHRDPVVPADIPDLLRTMLTGLTARNPAERLGHVGVFNAVQSYLVSQQLATRGITAESLGPTPPPNAAVGRDSAVLDSPDEATFDSKARIAAALLAAPVATITMYPTEGADDEVRQYGWSDYRISRDSSLAPSIGTRSWQIPDTFKHPTARLDPLVTHEPHIRASVGVPLTLTDGTRIGALIVLDTQPRTWSPKQLADLADMARATVHEIELRHAIRRAMHSSTRRRPSDS